MSQNVTFSKLSLDNLHDIDDARFRIRPYQQIVSSCTGAFITSMTSMYFVNRNKPIYYEITLHIICKSISLLSDCAVCIKQINQMMTAPITFFSDSSGCHKDKITDPAEDYVV